MGGCTSKKKSKKKKEQEVNEYPDRPPAEPNNQEIEKTDIVHDKQLDDLKQKKNEAARNKDRSLYFEWCDRIDDITGTVEKCVQCTLSDFDTIEGPLCQIDWPEHGVRYIGEFKDGECPVRHGKGMLHWKNGNNYKGEICVDTLQGWGELTLGEDRKYRGHFVSNSMQGVGQLVWSDGRMYYGEYSHDMKNGLGRFIWPDGHCYIGEWCKGRQHGAGFYFKIDEIQRRKGLWNNGEWICWGGSTFSLDEIN
eukprot:GHVL01038197.1.p1 GENE.GHVL01038197.1~~GHVL01038197.1.p1  ORF type:complete len:251 (+),score=36.19 GHVL01038197.1:112-864(+)